MGSTGRREEISNFFPSSRLTVLTVSLFRKLQRMSDISDVYAGLEPAQVWRHFAALNLIPRPSGREAMASAYVRHVAESHGATWKSDARGNTVVSVPATPGRENAAPVCLQAHLDMVCEKRPDVEIDFTRDAIRPQIIVEDGAKRVYATGTTLGADNGLGAAMILAVLTDSSVSHGPLELLFTVEEETGLHGAAELDGSLISAKKLINLDTEDPREIVIGCAGGSGVTLTLLLQGETLKPGHAALRLKVGGLQGGHSGIEIHQPRGNAIKVLNSVLDHIGAHDIPFHLLHIEGGQAHNAIPRDAWAEIALSPDDIERVRGVAAEMEAELHGSAGTHEPDATITLEPIEAPASAFARPEDQILIALLSQMPHGVLKMSERFAGKVETSSNLAVLRTKPAGSEFEDAFEVSLHVSLRSFSGDEIKRVRDEVINTAQTLAPAIDVDIREGYPGWEPNPGELLETTKRVYKDVFGREAIIEIVHAGLECGIIADKVPGLEAVSFGPLIKGAHTPEEWADVQSTEEIWKLLAALLQEI
jgi:dipeptidase D